MLPRKKYQMHFGLILLLYISPKYLSMNDFWKRIPMIPAEVAEAAKGTAMRENVGHISGSEIGNVVLSRKDKNEDVPLGLQPGTDLASESTVKELLEAIVHTWKSLLRGNHAIGDLVKDPKVEVLPGQRYRLYVRAIEGEDTVNEIRNKLLSENHKEVMDKIEVLELPPAGQKIEDGKHGALYLPHPYVVPGGVFQEMYAWDSFFIALGLLGDQKIDWARGILENYIYQIENYGTILNGNRTYYLTRSQLPIFTTLINLIYPHVPEADSQTWLLRAVSAAEKYHAYWVTGPHQIEKTGLSRFYDLGPEGSIPPEIAHEVDSNGASAYQRVQRFFEENHHKGILDYDISEYYNPETRKLKPHYMDSDRAMRESGFDTSHRFGPFNAKILDFNPVCLNSLLFKMEKDISELHRKIDPTNSEKIEEWAKKSLDRQRLVHQYNWDEEDGLFYDYDFKLEKRRKYKFGTTFLPLWTGIATENQAKKVAQNGLAALEVRGGLATSDRDVGCQWDMPYAWAPLQYFAVEGLRKYELDEEAERLATNWGSMVLKTWMRTGKLFEKYNAVKRDETVELKYGYPTNEEGFGWTNAIFSHFHRFLSHTQTGLQDLMKLDGVPIPSSRTAVKNVPEKS